MMEVTARTPGKLVLLGDYAVLEGAPALAMAVNRHAKVRIAARPGGVAAVSAPDMQVSGVPLKIDEQGAPQWLGTAEQAQALRLVDETLRGLQHEGLAPAPGRGFDLHLDTSGYFDQGAQGRAKLGLGSSAALTVALASAMTVFVGRGPAIANRRVWLEHLLALHRQFQGGHGSGVDVATSLIGGVISYRLLEGGTQPRAEPVGWPKGVHLRFVWSGRSASTSDFLGRLAQWRQGHGADYASHMGGLTAIAQAATDAVTQGRDAAFVDAASAYAGALSAFGTACGLDIFSAEHQALVRMAAESGVGYKPCGAGGGDFGVAFSLEPERLDRVERRIAEEGFRCVPLAVDEQGLHLEYTGY